MKKDLTALQEEFLSLWFGMFIHFNSATFQFNTGGTVDWEYDCENGGAKRKYPFNPADWNPIGLDCGQWARAAKSAGARFAALTTKHHEGFCLWSSSSTEHCVKNSPVKTDVVSEYMSAFRAEGILPGLYYSVLDLTNGITRTKFTHEGRELIEHQITELLTGYGEIPFLIIDGWNAPWGGPSYDALPFEELDALVKGLQPNCLLMNIGETDDISRTDILFFENAHGQSVPSDFSGPGIGCNILTGSWFWRGSDPSSELKSAQWASQSISRMNAQNVAFILNASPDTRGLIDDNLLDRYAEIGKTLKIRPPLKEIPKGWLKRN